jgi:nucleoside-diphosphate-sugar epimerase
VKAVLVGRNFHVTVAGHGREIPVMEERRLVLVTGGSGYIAGFCIARLMREGWRVRATVRSLRRSEAVRASLSTLVRSSSGLSFVAADLDRDAGWADAAAGCDHVLHIASPLPSGRTSEEELVRPARDGALRVLAAAQAAGVKRVVMTSSIAAVAYGRGLRRGPFTEADWTDETNLADTSAYERSKTIAERAAWTWVTERGGNLELATINPGLVLGPLLSRDYAISIDVVKRLLDGSLPGLPAFGWPLVDVRDIADLHLRAMTDPKAAGERFIAAGSFYWMADVARTLRSRRPELAKRVPTRRLPDWLLKLAGFVEPMLRDRLFELGKKRTFSSDKARALLGWSPRPNDETIVDTADSLAALEII